MAKRQDNIKSYNNKETNINWFPGHMAKTRKLIEENLKEVDLTIELLDARIPIGSQNPEIVRLTGSKPRLTLLSKSSLADPKVIAEWKDFYEKHHRHCIFYDVRTGQGINEIAPKIKEMCKEKLEKYQEKGMAGRKLTAMIVGIPNVGKSSLINRLAEDKKAKAENRPGVTVRKQWVSTSIGIDLLDTPGVLWPKFEDKIVAENLAITGAIKDDIMDIESIATTLCSRLRKLYPELLCQRYKLTMEEIEDMQDWEVVELIGRRRGFLISGGEVNYERASNMLIDEFRNGMIGKITLERPRNA